MFDTHKDFYQNGTGSNNLNNCNETYKNITWTNKKDEWHI